MSSGKPEKKSVPINEGFYAVNTLKWDEKEKKLSTLAYMEYRRKWEENPRSFTVNKAPLHIDIEVTNACNLKCPMCLRTLQNEGSRPYEKIGVMDSKLYNKIIDEACEIGVSSIKLVFRGEPLIDKHIADKVRYAKEKGIIDIIITTNGTLLTEELSRALINAGLDKLSFSFDSPYKEDYEAIRIGADYDETLANIRRFAQIRNELESEKPLTRVTMVAAHTSSDVLEAYNSLFSDIVDSVCYQREINCRIDDSDKKHYEEELRRKSFACSQPWQRLAVTWDGIYAPCCWLSSIDYPLGSACESSVSDIWSGEKINRLRQMHMDGSWLDVDMCRECQISYIANEEISSGRTSDEFDGVI